MPGCPTDLNYRARPTLLSVEMCGWGLSGYFLSPVSFRFCSPSLWETASIYTEKLSQRTITPKQPTNQESNKHLLQWKIETPLNGRTSGYQYFIGTSSYFPPFLQKRTCRFCDFLFTSLATWPSKPFYS